MKTSKAILISALSVSIVACAGKTAHPVASYKTGDEALNCPQLKAEMAHIDAKVLELIPQSEKTGKNVALGVAGWFLIVPWFFMDLSDAEQVEIAAYKERYLSLEKLYSDQSCAKEPLLQKADTEHHDPQPSASKRLASLKELQAKGLISSKEYDAQRNQIISGI